MKSEIKKQKTKSTKLTFADLEPGKLYNYNAGGTGSVIGGIVLCMSELYANGENKRLVELRGDDAGEYWNTVMDADPKEQHLGVIFTPFTDKLELFNE